MKYNTFARDTEPAMHYLDVMTYIAFEEHRDGVNSLLDFKDDIWFWKEIAKRGLLRYLDLATDETLAESAKSLLFAFTYPGTREALIRVAHGVYGSHSVVFVEDDKFPAVLSLRIRNANVDHLLSMLFDIDTCILTEDRQFVLLMLDITRAVFHNAKDFLKKFLTPGRVLERVIVEVD